ncbi:MAG: IS630 family transposase [Planctomycetes bacterium]|nr:IS630 family transposase [Planctomycetota bacterium]
MVRLELTEREELERIVSVGKRAASKLMHARVLLQADQSADGPGWTDARIAEGLGITARTVENIRRRFVEEGLEAALERKRQCRPSRARLLDGAQAARLTAICCSKAPQGRPRWTLRMLADHLVELNIVDSISHETVRRTLPKNELKPWRKRMWCIPPEQNAAFVCAMEDVLEVYQRPYDPKRPVVCMDETSKQLVRETRLPQPARPGQPERFDYEYERNGTANVFMFCEPLAGRRRVAVTDRRTRCDWADQIRMLLEVHYRRAERVTLVMDNLNTHSPASLYEAFEPAAARRLIDRLEIVHTPKHGSWLNMAEIELSVLSRQCLGDRVPDQPMLAARVARWQKNRNTARATIDWQFTTADARIKLRRLYPKTQT